MIKSCPVCHKDFDGAANRKYCSKKCKKTFENSQRSAPAQKKVKPVGNTIKPPSAPIKRPHGLNEIAAAYWDKLSPTLIQRGHLNILSEDAFAELCDLYSRLVDIRKMIDTGTIELCKNCGAEISLPGNRSLLQLDDKWSINDGIQTQTFKESALSDLKRKYSKQFLDYCKAFYLTPLSVRGNFGFEPDEKEPEEEFLK